MMTRYFLSCVALVACFSCLPGCGGGTGSEAEFTESAAQTEAEVSAEEDYMKQMQQQQTETYGK